MFFQPVYSRTLDPENIVKTEMITGGGTPGSTIDTDTEAMDGEVYLASEEIMLYEVVNIYDEDDVKKVRRASALDNTKPAMGFIKECVNTGDEVTVYFEGLLGLPGGPGYIVGNDYFLSTEPGLITTSPPGEDGNIWQKIGVAISTDNIEFEPGEPITRA
jgi:hypothetical protein